MYEAFARQMMGDAVRSMPGGGKMRREIAC